MRQVEAFAFPIYIYIYIYIYQVYILSIVIQYPDIIIKVG